MHWTRIQNGFALVGEIDFAVVSSAGKLLLIEQKSGFLSETSEGLVDVYATQEKSVPFQIGRSMDAFQNRLGKFCPDAHFFLDSPLCCPDYTVKQPGSADIVPERIVDATRHEYLCRSSGRSCLLMSRCTPRPRNCIVSSATGSILFPRSMPSSGRRKPSTPAFPADSRSEYVRSNAIRFACA